MIMLGFRNNNSFELHENKKQRRQTTTTPLPYHQESHVQPLEG
jgi:hypothetical protein